MFSKLLLLSAFMLPLSLAALENVKKMSKLSGDALINSACKSFGPDKPKCTSILETATPEQKGNAVALTIFMLRYVESHAVNVSNSVKKVAASPYLPPLLQAALTECREQYNSVDDLIDEVVNAIEADAHKDALEFIDASIASVHTCDSKLEANNKEEKVEDRSGVDVKESLDLTGSNLLLQNLLTAASNLIKEKS